VLHLTAALAIWWTVGRRRPDPERPRWRPSAVDLTLAVYLALSVVSAAFASNRWLAARALAISVSGAAIFWAGRALTRRGLGRQLLATAAGAAALAAATSLLQAYGVESEYFSLNRAPGGTFGNRNFVAHLAAIGAPLLIGVGLRARHAAGTLAAAVGVTIVVAMLVLSRTRAAWLALAVCLVPLAIGLWRTRTRAWERSVIRPGRVVILALACAVAAGAAVLIPNTLEWRSDSPYLDSMRGMVDYRGGSGGGRLKQWRNSARMLADHPIVGVGPGNWPVRYPRYAPGNDPSLADDGMTANPWPSSDWVANASERGVAVAGLGAVFTALAWCGYRAVRRRPTPDAPLVGGLLGSLVTATAVVGAFDAVLLLAAPTLVVWMALGALFEECRERVGAESTAERPSRVPRRLIAAGLAATSAVAAVRSGAQWSAMALFSTGRTTEIDQAGKLDPGSYRVRLRLAELAARRGRCPAVREHAGAARELFPEAAAPRRLLTRCPQPRARRR
jgi:O-antigen ligase